MRKWGRYKAVIHTQIHTGCIRMQACQTCKVKVPKDYTIIVHWHVLPSYIWVESTFYLIYLKIITQINNHKSFLILGCRSFAEEHWNLKTHKYHQVWYFFPVDSLPGLYCSCLLFLLVLRAFCLQQFKCVLNWIQVRWLTCHCEIFHFLALKDSWVALDERFKLLSICTVIHRPQSFEAFYWIWVRLRIFHAAFVNLIFLFLRQTSDVHLEINPLYLLWWRLLLIIDFDTDTPTSVLKGLFSSPGKEFFCHTTQLFSVSFWAVQCSWATDSKFKCHMWNKLETFHLHKAITCTLTGNSWAVNCQRYQI